MLDQENFFCKFLLTKGTTHFNMALGKTGKERGWVKEQK